MNTYDFPHRGRAQTARMMYSLAENFAGDLGQMGKMPFISYWNRVRAIPYISDDQLFKDPTRELLGRPAALFGLLENGRIPGLDCKKKAILLGSWAEYNKVPWRLVGMSEKPDQEIHHVFPLVFDGRAWVNADATYPTYKLGAAKPEMTYAEIFAR